MVSLEIKKMNLKRYNIYAPNDNRTRIIARYFMENYEFVYESPRSTPNKLRNIFTSIGLNTFKRVYKSRSSFSRFLNKSIDENKLNIAN